MQLANKEIREKARSAGVRLWQISKEIGVSESTLTRMLREELPENEANHLKTVIDRIGGEGGAGS